MATTPTWTERDRYKAAELAPEVVTAIERLQKAHALAARVISRLKKRFPEAGDGWTDFVLDPLNEQFEHIKTKDNNVAFSDMSAAIRELVMEFRDHRAGELSGAATEAAAAVGGEA